MQTYSNISKLMQKFNNDENVIKLQNYYNSFSFMEILGVERNEAAHSSFLAWLLDSNKNGGLGTLPLKLLLELLVKRIENDCKEENDDIKKIERFPESIDTNSVLVRSLNIVQGNVEREYSFNLEGKKKGRVDLYIPFEVGNKQYVIIVENKVKSSENYEKADKDSTQTDKYYEYFSAISKDKYIYVFLSPLHGNEVVEATNKHFINISYPMIVENIITPLLANKEINPKVRMIIEDYLKILNKPNADDTANQQIVLAVSEAEKELIETIKVEHELLIEELKKLDEYEKEKEEAKEEVEKEKVCSLLQGFKDYNDTILTAICPELYENGNRKRRTFAELKIESGTTLYLAKSGASNEIDDENNLYKTVRTVGDNNRVEYFNKERKTVIGSITAAAKELSGKPYNLNGFQWFIEKRGNEKINLYKIK